MIASDKITGRRKEAGDKLMHNFPTRKKKEHTTRNLFPSVQCDVQEAAGKIKVSRKV